MTNTIKNRIYATIEFNHVTKPKRKPFYQVHSIYQEYDGTDPKKAFNDLVAHVQSEEFKSQNKHLRSIIEASRDNFRVIDFYFAKDKIISPFEAKTIPGTKSVRYTSENLPEIAEQKDFRDLNPA